MANDVYKDPGDRGVNGWNTLDDSPTKFDSGLNLLSALNRLLGSYRKTFEVMTST
jgi:hypothetical protein